MKFKTPQYAIGEVFARCNVIHPVNFCLDVNISFLFSTLWPSEDKVLVNFSSSLQSRILLSIRSRFNKKKNVTLRKEIYLYIFFFLLRIERFRFQIQPELTA